MLVMNRRLDEVMVICRCSLVRAFAREPLRLRSGARTQSGVILICSGEKGDFGESAKTPGADQFPHGSIPELLNMRNRIMSTIYTPPSTISVRGATAPSGKPYIRIEASGTLGWIARDA